MNNVDGTFTSVDRYKPTCTIYFQIFGISTFCLIVDSNDSLRDINSNGLCNDHLVVAIVTTTIVIYGAML